MTFTSSAATSHCSIDHADYQDGIWHVRATITTPQGNQSGEYQIEGPEDMSYAAIQDAVLALYATTEEA